MRGPWMLFFGIGALFSLAGILVIAAGRRVRRKHREFREAAVYRDATIVRYDRETVMGDEGMHYAYTPVVRVEGEGRVVRSRTRYGGENLKKKHPKGSAVEICYLPEEPDDFRFVGRDGDGFAIFLIAGGAFLAVGLYLFYMGLTI